jgi:glycyl-tRNA synthetase alpha subunit
MTYKNLVMSYTHTLNVEKASDAISNVETSTYLKKLKKSSA